MSEHHDPTALARRKRSDALGTRRRKANPPTEPACLDQLKVGDVVMQHRDHPVVILHVGYAHAIKIPGRASTAARIVEVHTVYCRYVWADPNDPSWILGDFEADDVFQRAV
ncbi:hypothetical protein [Rathayibacter sp. VKM Ac-2754]|uniref:hypothetical protein n=1 Tax=Rathayibacter sp. VKM Ac-2754 TaxID=2609251 RepID=UPI00135C684B|nr:hypothetical protein [Rathayibacter sp. VKM Ac-2754]MWV57438.1 hypothetical protein [Rathayibacter sp. VKM Ac-2754]